MPATIVRTDASPAARAAVRRRLLLVGLALGGWGAAMGYRLADLQVYRAEEMRTLARRQHEQIVTLDARRGLLLDRNGRELAMSIEVDSIYAVPAEIDDPSAAALRLAPVLARAAGAAPVSTAALAEKLRGDKLFAWVRRKVDPDTAAAVEALGLKGIGLAREHRRFYPHGSLASHVLGWVGMDNVGMDGLELALDRKIRGQDGQMFALRDARGRRFLKATQREPVPGRNVALTIDETIQHIAERELRAAMDDTGAREGSVIVMQPSTGDVLALANEPGYNPNRPADVPPEYRKNRSVVDTYEPGSTFKVVTMAAALERGLVSPGEMLDCQHGSLRVGRAVIHDHRPFGLLTATEVLQQSSNVGAMKIGLRLRREDFHETMKQFGFGAKTGIELPGEARGLLRDPSDWSGVSQATLSFGQEIGVTALQLVTAINAVANGGVLEPPRLVLGERDAAAAGPSDPPRAGRRILQHDTVRTLTRMMLSVVDDGTAKAARMPGYSVAGKTGTAQKIGPEGTYAAGRFVASFAGFVPSTDPALTILVVLDEPRGSLYHGGDIAAPVFRRIALPALRYLGVPTEEERLLIEGDEPTLTAAAHAVRWTEPLPVDEKELAAERARREKRERLDQETRQKRERARRNKGPERDVQMAVPVKQPLPPPAVAGDAGVALVDLRGHSLRRAVSYLSRVGLRVRVLPGGEEAPDGDGVVADQEPAPGTLLAAGAQVALRPGRLVAVPVTDPSEADAPDMAHSVAPSGTASARRSMR